MTAHSSHLTELISSRICHDLISPLGAISNGVELLSMAGGPVGPEMSLISQSIENANARIRYFRIAFGAAHPGQSISVSEIVGVLRDLSRGGRMVIEWQPKADLDRQHVKLAFLVLQCFETAMPWGGKIVVSAVAGQWAVYGQAENMQVDRGLWQGLDDASGPPDLQPAQVHFALAPLTAAAMGRRLSVETSTNSARVRF